VGVDAILVERAGAEPGHEQLPDPRRDPLVHAVGRAVPAVEVADDAHGIGVGRPDGEVDAGHTVDDVQLGPELLVALPVAALADEVEVEVGEHGGPERGGSRFNRCTW
jgi:hypothetical protein